MQMLTLNFVICKTICVTFKFWNLVRLKKLDGIDGYYSFIPSSMTAHWGHFGLVLTVSSSDNEQQFNSGMISCSCLCPESAASRRGTDDPDAVLHVVC